VAANETRAVTYQLKDSFMSPVVSTVTTMRSALAHRRSARRVRVQLERELASYDTPSARHELDAILSRHSAADIAPIEHILTKQSVSRTRTVGGR